MATQSHGEDSDSTFGALILAVAERSDRAAFARLFAHFAPRIKGYCLKRGSAPTAAEEIAQESLIQVWRRAGQFDPSKASAATWIFAIARNKRIDAFRRESRPELTAEDLEIDIASGTTSFDHVAEAEIGDSLAEKVAGLPPDQAQVIHKAFYEDKTHQAIAAELDLPLGTVKSRIRLALARLRNSISEQPS
ncbi:MAG: sigma-70 family RNA polymerase sigma factor [Alphaproteobacteria bacterium]